MRSIQVCHPFVGRRKKASFNYIKEKFQQKLQGWEEKLLSQAEREVLIKVVMQAIPTFTMSCFKIPLSGAIKLIIEKFIGLVGKPFVNRRRRELCISKIQHFLTMHSLLNRFGVLYIMLRYNFSHMPHVLISFAHSPKIPIQAP